MKALYKCPVYFYFTLLLFNQVNSNLLSVGLVSSCENSYQNELLADNNGTQ